MDITERHELILKKLQEDGKVKIQELSDLLNVSGVTIRKDLKLLEDKQLLFRTKGGASTNNPYMNERPINEKELINFEEKEKIAKEAVKLIGNNDSIIIGSGTTVYQLAKHLNPQNRLNVITPAVKVTIELCDKPNIETIQLGGIIRKSSSSITGPDAENTLENISSGLLFLGVDGIDLDFGISITNLAEATLNKKMIDASQSLIVLADSSKFGRRGLGKICSLDQVQYIITDEKAPSGMIKSLLERDIKVIIAK
ncbi:DeoR/GlpR family DNA-binding transcription regulator [Echinicola shivajiensis]|uniref:DeoR/GlpR family DNA-binding transcription regulator n=1 Tax=Echinicola shivajiensis TaxID=1035916 RepID=UPI001BFC350F|nr:DeoR/GlpR family DNA-binding transcription regulator [Echinicola shivajiensis]